MTCSRLGECACALSVDKASELPAKQQQCSHYSADDLFFGLYGQYFFVAGTRVIGPFLTTLAMEDFLVKVKYQPDGIYSAMRPSDFEAQCTRNKLADDWRQDVRAKKTELGFEDWRAKQ